MSETLHKIPTHYKATTKAAAGSSQATATLLQPGTFNKVTGADDTKGVVLPILPNVGHQLVVANYSASALVIYPNTSGKINNGSANASITIGAYTNAEFIAVSTTEWQATFNASAASGATLTGTETLSNKTLTSPTVNTPVVVDATEVVTATNVITASESGKTFFLNSATEFVSTLPAPAAGLRFTFIVSAEPSGASYTIVTNSSANIIKGQVHSSDLNAASDGDFETSGGDTITLVDSKAVAGDRVDVYCDGTNWFAYCWCTVFDGITITTAS